MKIFAVSRHEGGRAWLVAAVAARGWQVDCWIDHLSDVSMIDPGDKVIGTLPIQLAAQVCARGAEYWHLAINPAPEQRGVELSAQSLHSLAARLERFVVLHKPTEEGVL